MKNINLNSRTQQFRFNEKSFLHSCSNVSMIETQVSWLIKTGDYCYKIKKDFFIPGVLDYRGIRKRQNYIKKEVERNKLLSQKIYCGIVSLSQEEGVTMIDMKIKKNREWAVLMHQFGDNDVLTNRSIQKKIPFIHWVKMLQQLTNYYKRQSFKLNPDYIQWRYKLHLKEGLRSFLPVNDIKAEFAKWYKEHKADVYKRSQSIVARQTHGDLHLKNLVWYRNTILPFDCLEFNDKLSIQDPLMDIAFLIMDLHFYHMNKIVTVVASTYKKCMNDNSWKNIFSLYLSLAALIRGIVVSQEGNYSSGKQYLRHSFLYLNKPLEEIIKL